MLDTASVSVPGVLGLGAGFTSLIVPLTDEPAGITTLPAALRTSSTTCAVNGSPALAVRDVIVSVAAMSKCEPAASVNVAGAAGGLGRWTAGRDGGVVVWVAAAGGVAGGVAGASRIAADESAGARVRLRAVESADAVFAFSPLAQAPRRATLSSSAVVCRMVIICSLGNQASGPANTPRAA